MESLTAQSPGSCHSCIYEWTDACDKDNLHLPSNKVPCRGCCRNPNPTILPAVDHYVNVKDGVDRMAAQHRRYPC